MTERDSYVNPLATRYASKPMLVIFGESRKFETWRQLWLRLAMEEMRLGIACITGDQLVEMSKHLTDINYEVAEQRERAVRHDVMAHAYAFGVQCPDAAPIIHLGATSAYVTDNTDIILLRDALRLVRSRLVRVIRALMVLAEKHKATPCLSYTHFQPAQPTTFGRRVCMWISELLMDLDEVQHRLDTLKFLGVKGATGTQASFLELFENDHDKVMQLDRKVAEAFQFEETYEITGQTPSRKIDAMAMQCLSGVAQTLHKMANDLRLLMGLGHVEEPSGKSQIGSSAMAYKKNPMKCERMTSLARLVMGLAGVSEHTAAEQWLERTLDDSAGKRIVLPEAFLAVDACLILAEDIGKGLVVFPAMLLSALCVELPMMVTEKILMRAVALGGDRQLLHEQIRVHSRAVARAVKEEGRPNDMVERLLADPAFAAVHAEIPVMLDPMLHVGRSVQQVERYLAGAVTRRLAECPSDGVSLDADVKV